jgi:hypothetical protein
VRENKVTWKEINVDAEHNEEKKLDKEAIEPKERGTQIKMDKKAEQGLSGCTVTQTNAADRTQ